MSTRGLADLVLSNPTLAHAMATPRAVSRPSTSPVPQRCGPSWSRGSPTPAARSWWWPRPCARPRTSPRSSATCSPPQTVALYPAWETLPHERLSPRSDTVGRRLAVLRRLRHPGADGASGPRAGHRRAGAFRAAATGQGPRRPRRRSSCSPARRSRSTPSSSGSSRRPTRASTSSRSAASSPCAAASSTSSRRSRSTPCGWSSSATRSRRSARFAVADQRTMEPGRAALGAALPRAPAR